jgi:hypothetical protein
MHFWAENIGKKYADGFLIVEWPLFIFVEKIYFLRLKKKTREF